MKVEGWGWPGTKIISENKNEEEIIDKLFSVIPEKYKSIGEEDWFGTNLFHKNINNKSLFISNGE